MTSAWKDLRNPLTAAFLAILVNFSFIIFSRTTAEISPDFDPLTFSSVGFATALTSFLAYGVLQVFVEYTENPKELFLYFSSLVLIASFGVIGHLATGMPESRAPEINVLGTVHVITAVFIVGTLLKLENRKNRD